MLKLKKFDDDFKALEAKFVEAKVTIAQVLPLPKNTKKFENLIENMLVPNTVKTIAKYSFL